MNATKCGSLKNRVAQWFLLTPTRPKNWKMTKSSSAASTHTSYCGLPWNRKPGRKRLRAPHWLRCRFTTKNQQTLSGRCQRPGGILPPHAPRLDDLRQAHFELFHPSLSDLGAVKSAYAAHQAYLPRSR